ncbi:MAG: GNAT family N-acetyltransferase [Devosia sp.]
MSMGIVSDRYAGWLNDPEVVRFSENRHRKHTVESCAAYVASIDGIHSHLWAIMLDGEHVGNVGAYRDIPNQTADIGIIVGERSAWGKGVGSTAYGAAANWLLGNGCRMVTGGTMAVNTGMLKVFSKCGFSIAGYRPEHFLLDGRPVTMVMASKHA